MRRWLLIIYGLGFVLAGVAFLARPRLLELIFSFDLPSPRAMAETRAMYGGFSACFGVFLMTLARRAETRRAGMAGAALAFGGFALGRFVGVVVDGARDPISLGVLALEVLLLAVSLHALRGTGHAGAAESDRFA